MSVFDVVERYGPFQLLRDGETWRIVKVDPKTNQVFNAPGDGPPASSGAHTYFAPWTDEGIRYVSKPLTEKQALYRWNGITNPPGLDWCKCGTPFPDDVTAYCDACNRLVKEAHERLEAEREKWVQYFWGAKG